MMCCRRYQNGLLLELLQDIPEASVSLKIANCIVEIVQVQNQAIKVIKLINKNAPAARDTTIRQTRNNQS